jgi:hypothetical protein
VWLRLLLLLLLLPLEVDFFYIHPPTWEYQ